MTASVSESALAPVNTVTWWEIPVRDIDKAKTFYAAVFGWTLQPFGEGYVGIYNDSTLIGGLFEAPDKVEGDGLRIYVNVADLEATVAAAEAAGGSVSHPREEVGGDMGWWAEITDDGGRRLGLCTGNAAR
jgi:predicted enzyme related to lactoylglutathione lyase